MAERRRKTGGKSMRVGGGGRFRRLTRKLAGRRGVRTPKRLAAWIGRRKYGSKRFAKMGAVGRRRSK